MASKIRVLNDHIINKIAAGEVIENPSSVVKELVENSLDAGATSICVEIQGGGRQLIRVSDNGSGMSADDALLCLERHATSKLRDVEDIHTILTMGFRGEAIPSIASISKFNLLTCPAKEGSQEPIGTMVIVDGGRVVSCSPAVRSQGTTIEIKSLFFNVPVRKKFLKSPSFDANEILKSLTLMALSSPEIKFELVSDGKNLLLAPPSEGESFADKMRCRIENVLGRDFAENMSFVEERKGDLVIEGMVGSCGYTRHNRTGQFLFINKRAVVSPLVAYAIKEGYGTAIPSGRFPAFVMHLTLPGELVDVNVHPQKREVRLRQEQVIKELLIKAVRGSLNQASPLFQTTLPHIPHMEVASPVFEEALKGEGNFRFQEVPSTWVFQKKTPFPSFTNEGYVETAMQPQPDPPSLKPPSISHPKSPSFAFQMDEEPPKALATLPSYILVDGSVANSFLARGGFVSEGLILADQKGMHSRILFEKLSQTQTGEVVGQTLLIPQKITLSPYDAVTLRASFSILKKMGFHIREAQENVFLIDAIPQLLGGKNLEKLMTDIVRDLLSTQTDSENEQVLIRAQGQQIASRIVKEAVSANKLLSVFEAQALLDQLTLCECPFICPFGKPIFAQLTVDELDKLFQR